MAAANQPFSALAQPPPLDLSKEFEPKARDALTRRLSELVSWPESRIPNHERQLAADILVGLLRRSSVEHRRRCAQGLERVHEAPKALLRYLARDEITVAGPLLEMGVGFDDSDLVATIRAGVALHWQAIAKRRVLAEAVTDALLQTGDVAVIETLLRNRGARLSIQGVEMAVVRSRRAPGLAPLLVARAELRPTQALVLFWWAGFETRVAIMRRFAVDRQSLIQELGDVFKLAAAEGWSDADTRKALQVIERRQRSRAAAERSPFGSLEQAILAAKDGVSQSLSSELAYLSGVKPATMARIFADQGGEAIGVWCKSVGLKRPFLLAIWKALRRPAGDPEQTDNSLGRAVYTFDTLATAKAQTVLRYWNWSLTAEAMDLADARLDDDDHTPARRNALLLLHQND